MTLDPGNDRTWTLLQPWFGELGADERRAVCSVLEIERLPGDAVWVAEGDRSSSLAVVLDGALVVRIATQDGPRDLKRVTPGDVVGEVALFDPGPASATVTALADTTIASLSFDRLEGLRTAHPEIASHLLRQLCRLMSERLRNINRVARGEEPGGDQGSDGGLWAVLSRWFGGHHG